MSTVAKVHQALGFLFLTIAVVMFFLAGFGTFGTEGFGAHVDVGRVLQGAALLLVILAAIGRREALPASIALFVLMVIQSVLAQVGDDVTVLGALHPVIGLLVLAVAHSVARGLPLPGAPAPGR